MPRSTRTWRNASGRASISTVPVNAASSWAYCTLKGFTVDDRVLYSGASLNDVYLQQY